MFEPIESRKSFASLLFLKGVTEPLTGVLKKYDVTIVKKIIDHPTMSLVFIYLPLKDFQYSLKK